MLGNRGITLIALIITIIVMIILVGVTVNVALKGGLFDAAQKAAEGTEYQADYETLQAGVVGAMASDNGITKDSLTANLPTGWSVEGEGPFTVTSPNGNVFTVYTDGTIETNNQEDTEVEKVIDEYPGDITDNGTRDGTESNPYIINSMEDLVAFGEMVDMGETYEGKIVKLGYNLDFNSNNSYIYPNEPYTSKEKGEQIDINENGVVESIKTEVTTGMGFNAIGELEAESASGPFTREVPFKGTFDGNNKVISNFYKNVLVLIQETVDDIGKIYSASLFAENDGIIKNLGVKTAKNTVLVSGIVGINGKIYNPENTNIGAVVENCFCMYSEESFAMGGLVAINSGGTIKNSYTSGEISISENVNVSGYGKICGSLFAGTIQNCCSSINTIKTTYPAASLIGSIYTENATILIENCYNFSGTIIGDIDNSKSNSIIIKNCYANGDIIREGGSVGGIIERYGSNDIITLESCYFNGRIDLNTNSPYYSDIDGLVGLRGDNVTITNSKYLEKSLYLNGELQPDDENAATEEEMNTYMKSALEVVNGDGAFKEDTNNINKGYPILSWQ